MKTLRILFIVFSVILCIPSISLQAAIVYEVPSKTLPIEKKKKSERSKKFRRKKRKRQLKKHLSLHQNNKSPEARKSITYFILTGSAVAIAAVFLVISLPFWFSIPTIIGVVFILFSLIFLIAAIVFLINGIIYLNKARAKKKALKS